MNLSKSLYFKTAALKELSVLQAYDVVHFVYAYIFVFLRSLQAASSQEAALRFLLVEALYGNHTMRIRELGFSACRPGGVLSKMCRAKKAGAEDSAPGGGGGIKNK